MLEFRSLACELLPCAEQTPIATQPAQAAAQTAMPDPSERDDEIDALREARFFRAHLREALEDAIAALLADIASEVVARELQCAPADISRVVTVALQRYEFETPLRVRVNPADMLALASVDLPVVGDEGLRRGDVHLELRHGAIDLALGVRLERLLSLERP